MTLPPMRDELRGMPPPDPLEDPISYHLWFDANECSFCFGTGFDLEALQDTDEDDDDSECDCEWCDGTGFILEVHEWLDEVT
jgi:hypothetical protein